MWSVYREDGSEGGGLKVCESGAGIKDEAALARSIEVEGGGGVGDGFPCDGDAGDAGVVERGVGAVGEHGRVRDAAGDGRVADVERARLGAPQRHQAVGEFLAGDGARLRDERQRPLAQAHQPAGARERAQVAVAAPKRHARDDAVADR